MNLEDLMLTEEELSALSIRSYPAEQIRDAAVAKFAWGIVEWLDTPEARGAISTCRMLFNKLEAAGIQHHEVNHDR